MFHEIWFKRDGVVKQTVEMQPIYYLAALLQDF